MTIDTKLDFKKYLGLMYIMTYRKPMMIFFTLLGLILVFFPLLYFLGCNIPYDKPPYFQLLFGIFIVSLLPVSVYLGAKKNFSSLGKLQERIIYVFTEENMRMTGETFDFELEWTKVRRILEMRKWILIYQSKTTAFILPKESFGENLNEFRSLIRRTKIPAKLKRQ
jgi:hypothetical protein